jgi:hypothetical protein
VDIRGKLTGSGGDLTMIANGTTLSSRNSLGEIQDRRVVVNGTNVTISNLKRLTQASTGGIALEIGGGSAVISGNTITSSDTGILVHAGGTITLGLNNSINGGNTGLRVDGLASSIAGLTLSNTAFNGQSASYVALTGMAHYGPEIINGGGAKYDGVQGQMMTPLQVDMADDRQVHFPDDDQVGWIILRTNTAYINDEGNLVVIMGNAARETLTLNSSNPGNVTVNLNKKNIPIPAGGNFDLQATGGRIIIFGLDGQDIINLSGNVSAEVFAGEGNDYIYGGAGNDVLRGEGGNDYIRGGSGDDCCTDGDCDCDCC